MLAISFISIAGSRNGVDPSTSLYISKLVNSHVVKFPQRQFTFLLICYVGVFYLFVDVMIPILPEYCSICTLIVPLPFKTAISTSFCDSYFMQVLDLL